MVDVPVRLLMPLAALALILTLPAAAALPDPDDFYQTDQPAPDLIGGGRGAGPDTEPFQLYVKDGGAGGGAGAGGAQVRTACQVDTLWCRVCLSSEGSGPLPVAIGEQAEGIGAGVDLGWVLGPPFIAAPPISSIVDHDSGEVDGPDGMPSTTASGQGQYGPYKGVFVDPWGHSYC